MYHIQARPDPRYLVFGSIDVNGSEWSLAHDIEEARNDPRHWIHDLTWRGSGEWEWMLPVRQFRDEDHCLQWAERQLRDSSLPFVVHGIFSE